MPEISSSAIVVFTSVSFLLVTEISSITRSMEMGSLAKSRRDDFEFYSLTVSNLSSFTFFHAINIMVLMSVGLVLVLLNRNLITALLIVPTLVIAVLLPLFEVREFDELLKDGKLPNSLDTHIKSILMIGTLLFVLVIFAVVTGGIIARVLSSVIVVVLFVAPWPTAIKFTNDLSPELKWI